MLVWGGFYCCLAVILVILCSERCGIAVGERANSALQTEGGIFHRRYAVKIAYSSLGRTMFMVVSSPEDHDVLDFFRKDRVVNTCWYYVDVDLISCSLFNMEQEND